MNNIIDDVNQCIASTIRQERETRSWSLTELANQAGVSRAMIYKIERGESSPTATLLGRIAGAFGISMSTLIARAEMQEGRLIQRSQQPVWQDPQSGYLRRHISPRGDVPLDMVEIELPAGSDIPMPAAAYRDAHQWLWMLEGELVFVEGLARHVLHAGDCLMLGPASDCEFINQSQHSCRYLVVRINTAFSSPRQ